MSVRTVALRRKPRGVKTPFGFFLLLFTLFPTQIAFQDLATLIARQPAVAARAHAHLLASPFGTIHAAMFTFPRPLGSSTPEPPVYQLASFDPRSLDVTGSLPERAVGGDLPLGYVFPTVERRLKGNLLVPRTAPHADASPAAAEPEPTDDPVGAELSAALRAPPLPAYDPDVWPPLDDDAKLPGFIPGGLVDPDQAREVWDSPSTSASVQAAHLYFGADPVGDTAESLEHWAPGDAPVEIDPAPPAQPALRQAALPPAALPPAADPAGAPAAQPDAARNATDAEKGEVTAARKGLQSPAERLHLEGTARAKAEKCLANAVYFEARGEPVRGQIAVAQVVMNRVFSGFYPDNVCGVVYQNAHRHLACQFTFACSGLSGAINEPDAWERAKRIAKETLDGKLWLPEVGKATHYHAYWVHPSWVHEMHKLYKLGVHTFYRPRAWGDGGDAPTWGDAATTAEEAKKL